MPMYLRDDDKPVVEFDPRLEMSPFTLFRRLREGRAPQLIDVRAEPTGLTFREAVPLPGTDWQPPTDADILLFDEDGSAAVALAGRLQRQGAERIRALFGGLQLYQFALDPEVVGGETHLIPIAGTDR